MANVALGMLLQLLLMLSRDNLYLWLLWPDRLNYMLLQVFTLAENKLSIQILIVDKLLEQLMILKYCGSHMSFLFPVKIKFRMTYIFKNYRYNTFTCHLSYYKIPGHYKLDSLEVKEITLLIFPGEKLLFSHSVMSDSW